MIRFPDRSQKNREIGGKMKKIRLIVSIVVFFSSWAVSESLPPETNDTVNGITLDLAEIGEKAYYGDICGDVVVFAVGPACDFTWDIEYKNIKTGESGSFCGVAGGTIDNQPKIDGDSVVWCGGPEWEKPWTHEPSNFSIFVRNLATGAQKTLRQYTLSESYSHPAISGNKVVWLEHLGLDPSPQGKKGKNWWNTPFNICGADITDIENPKYFTIAKNVGKKDPYPCLEYWKNFDNVIDISGNTVAWEANGDICGADISDPNQIEVFTICDDKSSQYDPAISGDIVVWTDQRNDGGDIYGVSILDMKDIKSLPIIKKAGTQKQPAVDNNMLVYVSSQDNSNADDGEIEICRFLAFPETIRINLKEKYTGQRPAVNADVIVWKGRNNRTDRLAQGISLRQSALVKKRINHNACAMED